MATDKSKVEEIVWLTVMALAAAYALNLQGQ